MSESPSFQRGTPAPPSGESLLLSLISAGFFLYVGFFLGLSGISDSAVYNASVAAFTWGARVVGIGLLVSTIMLFFRIPGATLLDLLLTGLAAGGCLIIGAIWLAFGDMWGIMLLLFGMFNFNSTKNAWRLWQGRRAPTMPLDPPNR